MFETLKKKISNFKEKFKQNVEKREEKVESVKEQILKEAEEEVIGEERTGVAEAEIEEDIKKAEKIEEAEGMKIHFAKLKDGRVVPYTSSIPLEGAEDYIGEKDSGVQLKQRKPDDIYLGDGVEFHDDEMDEKEKFMIPNT